MKTSTLIALCSSIASALFAAEPSAQTNAASIYRVSVAYDLIRDKPSSPDQIITPWENNNLRTRLQDFYREHDRWPTNAIEFLGAGRTTTRFGQIVLTPLSDGRLDASLVLHQYVNRMVVTRPEKP